MASRAKPAETRRSVTRLYLVTPEEHAGMGDVLAHTLEAADFAAVLLRLPGESELSRLARVNALGSAIQERGVALLLDGDAELAVRAGADGAHLGGVEALRAALPRLKPDRIAGCGRLATRHDAMVAGEMGADYVMFGEPDSTGWRPSLQAVLERVAWWAELFELPCVGFAAELEEVEPLARAGADFIAVGDFVFSDARGCAAAATEIARRIADAEVPG
jgi:thiamine-phosphate pyrophosphorylase